MSAEHSTDLPAGVTLHPWAEGDDLALLEVWGDPADVQQHQDRAMLAPDADTPWRRTLVAEDDGVPVGAGTVVAQSLHPRRLWLYLEVAPTARRRGVGSALLGALRSAVAQAHAAGEVTTTALKTRFAVASRVPVVTDGDADGAADTAEETGGAHAAQVAGTEAFLVAAGFTPVQRSRRIAVAPGSIALPPLRDEEHPEGAVLEDAATGSVELTRAVAAFYDAVHGWDPSEMSVGAAQQLILGPQTGAAGAVVLRDAPKEEGGEIRAFAVSYTAERQDAPADVFLGWDPRLPLEEAQLASGQLLAMLVAQHPVQVEVDEAMTALEPILDGLIGAKAALTLVDTRIWATDRV
ncbi:GNAT family N-acetyltransferase [Micrococcus luteus]|uniref:GNAT family N-acetyltransferase n=1 Tax=Micrococcus luteus TaxID=1270 RepID=UPI001A96C1B2|nr:GNAT family N-acetyltransferase [Micrococcus luteus]MCV7501906.1 GNAT family N-acetyltransferase [Micrococcus luteus]MCV7558143.1 GNAT family N-acetyltransferase [Micrococcus luteus]